MELRLLKYFLEVVREENISRAAEILHITQPTLSRQMVQLEESAGTKLFIRGKNFQLTDAGRILYHRAEEIVKLLEKTQSELKLQENLEGNLVIGCGGQKSVAFILECMSDFQKIYPKVTCEIYTNNADNIKEKIDKGLADFGILLEPIDISKYDYIRLHEKDCWGIFMQKNSPLAEKNFVTLEDLKKIPIITTNRKNLQKEIRNIFGEEFDKLQIKFTYNVITNVASLVAKKNFYLLTIDGAVELYDKNFFTFRPLKPLIEMSSVLVWKKFNENYGLAGKFLRHLRKLN